MNIPIIPASDCEQKISEAPYTMLDYCTADYGWYEKLDDVPGDIARN
jgi:hypothetical protein